LFIDVCVTRHVLDDRHARQPAHRDEILEERVELIDLGDDRLKIDRRLVRIEPDAR
jgi:hypothetical protein